LYIKESVCLLIRSLAGTPEPRFLTKGIYVSRDTLGLPNILPKNLKFYFMTKDGYMVKFILTLLSVYRVFPSVQKIKLGTIIDPFSGICRTLDPTILLYAVKDLLSDRKLNLRNMTLIKLETASPYS